MRFPTLKRAGGWISSWRAIVRSTRSGPAPCAGGSGNGPKYVAGPIYVVGYDEFDLDRDGDGVACER